MNIKTKIKNDLWHVNYIVPFAKKYLNGDGGKLSKMMRIFSIASNKTVVRDRSNRNLANDIRALLGQVHITIQSDRSFVYFIDEQQTIATPGNMFSNFSLDSNELVNGRLTDTFEYAVGDESDGFGKDAHAIVQGLKTIRDRIVKHVVNDTTIEPANKAFYLDCFQNIYSRPSKSFREGLQRILFLNQLLWQTRHRLNGLGRLDLILGDLYKNDIRTGSLTRELALDYIADFLELLHEHYEYKSDALMGDIGQIIILGGLKPDGSYFHNELTELFIEAQAASGFPDPKIFLRVSKSMPRSVMDKAVKALSSATGSPLFSNDDRVIPELINFGIEQSDAYNYAVSACWEPLIPGKSIGQNNILTFDAGSSFYSAILSAPDGSSYEDIVSGYLDHLIKDFRAFFNEMDEFKWAKDPLVSLFYPECINSRKDISEGGAKYSNYGITVVGIANAVDSLLNIRELLQRKHELSDLKSILESNFDSNPDLIDWLERNRQFGTDNEDAIKLTCRITDAMNDAASDYTNPLGGKFKFGLSSPSYIMKSEGAPADYSGRQKHDPYTVHISNASSAYTELVLFSAALDYSGHRFNGNVVDFFVAPNIIHDSHDKFVDFMFTSIGVGYFQMQMNVLDAKTLIAAKSQPDKYPGLIVRVWGFSAYFKDLPDSYKDYLIHRALRSEGA